MGRAEAMPVLHIDDQRFKVTEWRFEAGADTGWHVHNHDYVIVPLTDGKLVLEEPGGAVREAPLAQHIPYSRRAGVEHNVINGTDGFLAFLEVEVVDDALATRREALLARFGEAWNAHDLEALMACMAADCAFHASAGEAPNGRRHEGREAVLAAYAAVLEAFPDARWNEARHRVLGDFGLSSWRFTATDRGGRPIEVDGCDLFHFEGELIALKDTFRKTMAG